MGCNTELRIRASKLTAFLPCISNSLMEVILRFYVEATERFFKDFTDMAATYVQGYIRAVNFSSSKKKENRMTGVL